MDLMHLPAAHLPMGVFVRSCLLLLVTGAVGCLVGAEASPAATGLDWKNNPEQAQQLLTLMLEEFAKAKASAGDSSWKAWALGAVGAVLAIARFYPGSAGAVANTLWGLWASRRDKEAEAKRDVLAKGFLDVASVLRSFPKDTSLGQVIDKLSRELPEDVRAAYKEWERQQAEPRPKTEAEKVEEVRIKLLAEAQLRASGALAAGASTGA